MPRVFPAYVAASSFALLAASTLLGAPVARAAADAAHAHFEAGARAFDEQRFADAASEFERAYAAEPAWQLLYNLGSVYAALGNPVAAVDALRRYLEQGADRVERERREEVQVELERQRAKIGWVELRVNQTGAEVRVDAKLVGATPLAEPVALAAGAHAIDVSRDGYQPTHREIQVTAGQKSAVVLDLQPALRAEAPAPLQSAGSERGSSDTGVVQRSVGWVLSGAGLGGAIAGTVLATKGHLKHLDAVDTATGGDRDRAEQLESQANHEKTVGWAVLGVGAAVFVGGVVVVLCAPKRSAATAHLQLAPWAAASAAGLTATRTW